MRQIHKIIVAF